MCFAKEWIENKRVALGGRRPVNKRPSAFGNGNSRMRTQQIDLEEDDHKKHKAQHKKIAGDLKVLPLTFFQFGEQIPRLLL